MAHLLVVASMLAIFPPPLSCFCPLAPYCPLSWHLTANLPPADTLLLLTGWHPTPGWPTPPSVLSDRCTPPQLRPAIVLHCLRACRKPLGRTMSLPARWLSTVTVSAHLPLVFL